MDAHDANETLSLIYRAIMRADYAEASIRINEYWRFRVKGGTEPKDGDARIDNYVAIIRVSVEDDN